MDKFSQFKLDILKEIGNIGAGNAATSLSLLLNKPINMTVPSVRIASFDETMELAGGPEHVVAVVYLRMEGELEGSMFFVLSIQQAVGFIQKMTGNPMFSFDYEQLDEFSLSALQELGNIIAGSYLSALSDFTGMRISPSVPELGIDMAGAILGYGLVEFSQVGDFAIIIDTFLSESDVVDEQDINGHFFLLPSPESFGAIFNALGVNED